MTKEKLIRANEIEEYMAFAEWLSDYPHNLSHYINICTTGDGSDFFKEHSNMGDRLLKGLLGEDFIKSFHDEIISKLIARILERANEFAEEFKNL